MILSHSFPSLYKNVQISIVDFFEIFVILINAWYNYIIMKENQKIDELSQKLEAIDQQEALTHPMTGTRRWFFRALTLGIGGAILGNTKMVSGAPSTHDVCPKNSYLAEPYYCEGAHDTCTGDNTCVSGNVC